MTNEGAVEIATFIRNELTLITGQRKSNFTDETALIGGEGVIKSNELVELLLALEEHAEDSLGVEFDWRSDAAMSDANSIFRTIATLASHVAALKIS